MKKEAIKDRYYAFRENFHFWRLEKKAHIQLWADLHFPSGKKCYVVGTPTHTNVGDSAIVIAEMEFLKRNGVKEDIIKEITVDDYSSAPTLVKRGIRQKCPVFMHGGGNMGNQWMEEELFRRRVMGTLENNPIMIFPQTIFYTKTEQGEQEAEKSRKWYNRRENLVIVAREKMSYNIMQKLYPDAQIVLTPDIVLSSKMEDYGVEPVNREGVLLCFRNDTEKKITEQQIEDITKLAHSRCRDIRTTDMISDIPVSKENRMAVVRNKMQEFAGAELVITDRLHGMVFSALTGTPCVVFSNNNHKIQGTYEWIRYLPYIRYVETLQEAAEVFPELLSMHTCKFSNEPLVPYFNNMAEVVKAYACN